MGRIITQLSTLDDVAPAGQPSNPFTAYRVGPAFVPVSSVSTAGSVTVPTTLFRPLKDALAIPQSSGCGSWIENSWPNAAGLMFQGDVPGLLPCRMFIVPPPTSLVL